MNREIVYDRVIGIYFTLNEQNEEEKFRQIHQTIIGEFPEVGSNELFNYVIDGYQLYGIPIPAIVLRPNFMRRLPPINLFDNLIDSVMMQSTLRRSEMDNGKKIRIMDSDKLNELYPTQSFDSLDKSIQNENNKCTICLDEFEKDDLIRVLKCTHIHHKDCIDKWLTEHNNKCPVCRTEAGESIEKKMEIEHKQQDINIGNVLLEQLNDELSFINTLLNPAGRFMNPGRHELLNPNRQFNNNDENQEEDEKDEEDDDDDEEDDNNTIRVNPMEDDEDGIRVEPIEDDGIRVESIEEDYEEDYEEEKDNE